MDADLMGDQIELRNKIARAMYVHVHHENEETDRWGYTSSAHTDADLAEVCVDGGVDFLALSNIALTHLEGMQRTAIVDTLAAFARAAFDTGIPFDGHSLARQAARIAAQGFPLKGGPQ